MSAPHVGAVILGAGASRRMGRPKLLLPWGETTVLGQLVGSCRKAGVSELAVVVAARDAPIHQELDRLGIDRRQRIENPEPERGMFSSIRCAAEWAGWSTALTHWLLLLGDQPHLRIATIRMLLAACGPSPEAIWQPSFEDRPRHPVLFPRAAWSELATGAHPNLRSFLAASSSPTRRVPVDDPGLVLDIDTPEDYAAVRSWSLRVDPCAGGGSGVFLS